MNDSYAFEDTDFNLFNEPENYFAKEAPPRTDIFTLKSGRTIKYTLLGHHSLWAHVLWNAGKFLSDLFEEKEELVKDKSVLELGAGAALPSIVAAHIGASNVVATDYPEKDILDFLERNITNNCKLTKGTIRSTGYLWGSPVEDLLSLNGGDKFNVIIMSDLLFNHSEHSKILKTCTLSLKEDGIMIVAYSHHRPHLAGKDLDFFRLAEENGFFVFEESRKKMNVMFAEDPGDLFLRENVFMKILKLK